MVWTPIGSAKGPPGDDGAPGESGVSLDSPAFTGNPTAPTPTTGDNDTSLATTQFVNSNPRLPLAVTALPGSPVAGQIYFIVPTL